VTGDGPEVLVTRGWEIEVYGTSEGGAAAEWRRLGATRFQPHPECGSIDARTAVRDGGMALTQSPIART
jgi:hypothetical protein